MHLWQNSALQTFLESKELISKTRKVFMIYGKILFASSIQSSWSWHVDTRSLIFGVWFGSLGQGILYVDGWCASLALLSRKLSVDHYLVVSYPHQCHTGNKVSHWCIIIIAIRIMLLFAFSRAELWIILISYSHNCHMQCKRNKLTIWGILYHNVTVFLPKTIRSSFQIQKKLETCRNSNLAKCRRPSVEEDINVIFIL